MSVATDSMIHPAACVSPGADVAPDATIGPGAIIEDDVVIGPGCRIDSYAKIASGARLGANVRVAHGAAVGTEPQDLKFAGEKSELIVGDNTIIREYATLNRGTVERGETVVGARCLLMAYSHVAHDCLLGDHVILANGVQLAGHVEIGDCAILGGLVPVHQFVKIGKHVMVGGGFRVTQDICPFALTAGLPLKVTGLNKIGLSRRSFPPDEIATLQSAFKLLFFSRLNTTQAVERIKSEVELILSVRELLHFIESSTRGLIK
ncbi:MAG: acyl-ACP--UDP-N-acetylglucosamine O-acyltransferase [Candidatus Zixiibacteriota bacterium]